MLPDFTAAKCWSFALNVTTSKPKSFGHTNYCPKEDTHIPSTLILV